VLDGSAAPNTHDNRFVFRMKCFIVPGWILLFVVWCVAATALPIFAVAAIWAG